MSTWILRDTKKDNEREDMWYDSLEWESEPYRGFNGGNDE